MPSGDALHGAEVDGRSNNTFTKRIEHEKILPPPKEEKLHLDFFGEVTAYEMS